MTSNALTPSPDPHLVPLLVLTAIEAKRREIISEYLLLWFLFETPENSKNPAEENALSNGLFELRERSVKFTDPSGLEVVDVPGAGYLSSGNAGNSTPQKTYSEAKAIDTQNYESTHPAKEKLSTGASPAPQNTILHVTKDKLSPMVRLEGAGLMILGAGVVAGSFILSKTAEMRGPAATGMFEGVAMLGGGFGMLISGHSSPASVSTIGGLITAKNDKDRSSALFGPFLTGMPNAAKSLENTYVSNVSKEKP